MGIKIVYEPAYVATGWFQGSAGITPQSWCDRDLTSNIGGSGGDGSGGGVIPIMIVEPGFLDDDDEFLVMPPITVELTAGYFEDEDLIFVPMSIRALTGPDQMLRNEVRRVR